jgi:hypothetical protein
VAELLAAWKCRRCGNVWMRGLNNTPSSAPHHCYGDCGHKEFDRVYLDERGKERNDSCS